MEWSRVARQTIERVAATIPDATTFKERKALIEAAYPFGERAYWPRRAWCKARKAYLIRFDPKGPPKTPLFPNMPRDPVTGRPVIL